MIDGIYPSNCGGNIHIYLLLSSLSIPHAWVRYLFGGPFNVTPQVNVTGFCKTLQLMKTNCAKVHIQEVRIPFRASDPRNNSK